MKDERVTKLAKKLVNYSVELKKGERIMVDLVGYTGRELLKQIVKEVYDAGGIPFVSILDSEISKMVMMNGNAEEFGLKADIELEKMKKMDAYIAIRASDNIYEMSDVPSDKMKLYQKHFEPVQQQRVNHTKWCVLRYPNYSMAQQAGMPSEAFEDLYFNVCNLDYGKMEEAMDSLAALMEKTDRVRITGPGTDLTFSIKGIPVEKCHGKRNIPDGEVFTAPVRDSVNGKIRYTAPSVYEGYKFENVEFEFKDGKIIKATANYDKKLNEILDTDEGARYIGEFSLGVNPHLDRAIGDILFDEKIKGSFHFTPGRCYEDVNNGNKSLIHWDLVCIQTPEYGGGEIWFDGVLIRKDGLFVLDELKGLNPENLK